MKRIITIESWKNHINMINEQYNGTDKTLKIEYKTDQDIFDIGQKLKHNNIEHAWSAEIGTLIFNNKEDKEKAEKILNENVSVSKEQILSSFRKAIEIASKSNHDIVSEYEETIEEYKQKYPKYSELFDNEFEIMNKEAEKELDNILNKYEITLIENREGGEKIELVVDEKTYNKLIDINFTGGFKRFDIDLYDDKSNKELNYNGLEDFLSKVFSTSIENIKKMLNENVGVSIDFDDNELNKIKEYVSDINKNDAGLYCFLDYCLVKHSNGIDLLKKNINNSEYEDFKTFNNIDEFIEYIKTI